MKTKFTALLAAVLICVACTKPLEQNARDGVAAANGVLKTAQDQYEPACVADASLQPCQLINRGIAAKDTVLDALLVYCAGPSFTTEPDGKCVPQAAYKDKLQQALTNLERTISDVESVAKP